ncbi:MAG TPA: sigma-70 family RNA polymerase sigma factor [Blastocatellia bacterium]|nr:sigma-70 family RNA polymerase sigma factor [Blastocatellia bacterium]
MKPIEGITGLLIKWGDGDQAALDELMPLVYAELHRLARGYLRRERRGHTLQPTALVHEAYLRLVDQKSASWQNRAQFFGIAAQIMRRILVDHARQHHAAKRGAGDSTLSLDAADHLADRQAVDLIALDDALNQLATFSPQQGRIVELRFFGGLTIEETAGLLKVSHATVEREWSVARAWLRRELNP